MKQSTGSFWLAVSVTALLPALHPLMIPAVGVPSHLLWWVHVLPVAMVAFRFGLRGAVVAVLASSIAVASGEALFGTGYGTSADTATITALFVALTLTTLLVAAFALYARGVSRRYGTLFEASPSGIVRLNRSGRVEEVNPAAARLLGVAPSQLKGIEWNDIPNHGEWPPAEELVGQLWSGVVGVGEGLGRSDIHVSVTALPQDQPPGFQMVLVDRTSEVAHQNELERQGHLSTLGEALAGVAHELRNPIQVILSYSEMWTGMGGLPPVIEEDARDIQTQARRMRDMVSELLGFSRSREEGEVMELPDVVRRVVRMHRMTLGRSVRVVETIKWEGAVTGGEGWVEQILANLISNAAHAVGRGGGTITVSVVAGDAGTARVTVHDDGPGVPTELRDRIFRPFVTTKEEGEGTGLGLAISRRLARRMGGDLVLEETDGGAAFALELPMASPPELPEVDIPSEAVSA